MADTFRPRSFAEYIGQERLKAELDARIHAAQVEDRALEAILLAGPPGSGKTSLAETIADKMNEDLETLIMPVGAGVLLKLINRFEGVLVLDELQEMPKSQMFALAPLIEFGFLSDSNGIRCRCGRLSIIACTTNPEKLVEPLYDRFVVPAYDDYTEEEMTLIVLGMAEKAGIHDMDYEVALLFGRAACGVPRRARQFVVAYKALSHDGTPTADAVMGLLRTSFDGLTKPHMDYLFALKALGGARGLKHIADLLRLHPDVVTSLERLLFKKGLVEFTDRGRVLTRDGYSRLKTEQLKDAA